MSNQYPGPETTVDIAIFNEDYSRILLGRKKKEAKYRLIGGFAQSGENFEETAHREAKEETHLDLKSLQYVSSDVINDWRYRGERDKITTVLYTAQIAGGKPEPDDDIHELKWFDFHLMLDVVPNHKILIAALYAKFHAAGE